MADAATALYNGELIRNAILHVTYNLSNKLRYSATREGGVKKFTPHTRELRILVTRW